MPKHAGKMMKPMKKAAKKGAKKAMPKRRCLLLAGIAEATNGKEVQVSC